MKYVVKTQGSYVNDVHLRGGTKNGTFWASYTSAYEDLGNHNVWMTVNKEMAQGVADLVGGKVVYLHSIEGD